MAPGIRGNNFDPACTLFALAGCIGDAFSMNHVPYLVPGPAHAPAGISTQVVNAAAGTGAINIAGAQGLSVVTDGTFFYPIIPCMVGTQFSAAGEAATIVVVGRDTLGRPVTETIAKGIGGTAANGKVLWGRIDTVTITVNALAAQTFTVGTVYRTSTSITGAVFIPLPFLPRYAVATDSIALVSTAIPRAGVLVDGGGVWTNGQAMLYENSVIVPASGGKIWLPNGGVGSTYATTSGSSGVPVFTSTGGAYSSQRVLAMLPNVATPANVTDPVLWALNLNPLHQAA